MARNRSTKNGRYARVLIPGAKRDHGGTVGGKGPIMLATYRKQSREARRARLGLGPRKKRARARGEEPR